MGISAPVAWRVRLPVARHRILLESRAGAFWPEIVRVASCWSLLGWAVCRPRGASLRSNSSLHHDWLRPSNTCAASECHGAAAHLHSRQYMPFHYLASSIIFYESFSHEVFYCRPAVRAFSALPSLGALYTMIPLFAVDLHRPERRGVCAVFRHRVRPAERAHFSQLTVIAPHVLT